MLLHPVASNLRPQARELTRKARIHEKVPHAAYVQEIVAKHIELVGVNHVKGQFGTASDPDGVRHRARRERSEEVDEFTMDGHNIGLVQEVAFSDCLAHHAA